MAVGDVEIMRTAKDCGRCQDAEGFPAGGLHRFGYGQLSI